MNRIRVGNAPCSWGSLEFEGLAAKPIPYSQVLDEIAATGYQGTELGDWGFMPTDPEALEQELVRRRLVLLGAFVPVALKDPSAHAPGVDRVLNVARLLAALHARMPGSPPPFLVLADDNGTVLARTRNAGRITPDLGLTHVEWDVFARGANHIAGTVLRETSLRTVFHHHCAGYVETPEEIATLLERTDPDLLGLVLDTGHLALGAQSRDGAAVLEAMDRFASRTWYVHFKDCEAAIAERSRTEGWDYFTSVRNGVFCELGRGCVDFKAVRDRLTGGPGDRWVVVEQDVLPGLGTPKESAQRNRDFLRSLGI